MVAVSAPRSGREGSPVNGDQPIELEAGGPNAVAVTLGLLGDEWNIWLLHHAIAGCRRYSDWEAAGPISHTVLSSRLAQLTEAGLFDRVAYEECPARYEYRLTARGHAVWPILVGIWGWEQEQLADPPSRAAAARAGSGPLPEIRHRTCGRPFSPVITCGSCGEAFGREDVEATIGPSGGRERNVPASASRRRSARARRPERRLVHVNTILGDRWSAAILGALMLGPMRFGEIVDYTGAPPATVVDRLTSFDEGGMVEVRPGRDRANWVRYALTPAAARFFPVITLLVAWGHRWFVAPEGPALTLTHRECGARLEPIVRCDSCGDVLRPFDILGEEQD